MVVFNATVWYIWRERNDRIFKGEHTHKVGIFQQLEYVIQMRLSSSTKFSSDSSHQMSILQNWGCVPQFKMGRTVQFSWIAPAEECLKINLDGYSSNLWDGYAAIIRDFKSEVFRISHSYCSKQPIHLIELRGALLAYSKQKFSFPPRENYRWKWILS